MFSIMFQNIEKFKNHVALIVTDKDLDHVIMISQNSGKVQ